MTDKGKIWAKGQVDAPPVKKAEPPQQLPGLSRVYTPSEMSTYSDAFAKLPFRERLEIQAYYAKLAKANDDNRL